MTANTAHQNQKRRYELTEEGYIVSIEDFIGDGLFDYMKIPKPIRVCKKYAPIDENVDCAVSCKGGITNGKLVSTTEYFDTRHYKQVFYVRTVDLCDDYKIETLYDRSMNVISKMKITEKDFLSIV